MHTLSKEQFMEKLTQHFGSWASNRDRSLSAWYDCLQEFSELQFHAVVREERKEETKGV